MRVSCPRCHAGISGDDVNVARDTAFCRRCGEAFVLSELVGSVATAPAAAAPPELPEPPAGAWLEQTPDGFEFGATTRSPAALFLIPFTVVWSGFSVGILYGSQVAAGKFNPLFSLFGIPFLLGSMVLVSVCLLFTMGRTVVTVKGDRGSVFTGVFGLGRHKRFTWSEVEKVSEQLAGFQMNAGLTRQDIVLEGRRRTRFGLLLRDERRYFILQVLRAMLAGRNA